MPSETRVLPYTSDLLDSIIENVEEQATKDVTRGIIQSFATHGFSIKIQHILPGNSHAYYRVFCYIKGNKEVVSINTKTDHGAGGVDIKIRIANQTTFDNLDNFSDNVRNQILHGPDCRHCYAACEGKQYFFTYHGDKYEKCKYLGCNFRFRKIEEGDVASILDIVNGELAHEHTRRRL